MSVVEIDEGNLQTGRRRYLGDILVQSGTITENDLEKALITNKINGKKIGQILIEMGLVDDYSIASALSEQLSIPLLNLKKLNIEENVIAIIPPEIAKLHYVIPVTKDMRSVTLVMANPLDTFAVDDVRFATQLRVEIATSAEQDILSAISKYYPDGEPLKQGIFKESIGQKNLVVFSDRKRQEEDNKNDEDLLDLSDKPPVVRFINAILSDAIRMNASDIHVEPRRKSVVIRYRVDGIMREIMQTDRQIHSGILTRIKVLASMDISIRRAPQDGKFQVHYLKSQIDFRVSTLPTSYGEKITMRVLNAVAAPDSIEDLDISPRLLEHLQQAIAQPQGIVLVTGPTGSGKTTTLYTCLKSLVTPKVNVVTLENPIEYELEGINQVEINPKQGLSFAEGLRSVLRQDPDIVLLGEIRDKETAQIAFHAAQTGHLVLSTLHTNSALATVSRLEDLGIEPFNIATTLNAVVSQRLVRRLCPDCKYEVLMDKALHKTLPPNLRNKDAINIWLADGCESCSSTGYTGRMGIHEVFRITPKIRDLLIERKHIKEIERVAAAGGFTDLNSDGLMKAINGSTTLSEIYRVAPHSSEEEITLDEMDSDEPNLDVECEGAKSMPVKSISPMKILLVDDEAFMLQFVKGVLEGEGFLIKTAVNGVEGLQAAQREIPDLIITDYNMPKMNGMELIRKLRSKLSTSYIPTIILTGVDDVDNEIEGLNIGADDYVVKPFNARKLIARVNRLLKRQFSS